MIKFLIQQGAGANLYIRLTWVNALHKLGHQVVFWSENEKSALDIFYEFRPDVFIGSTWQMSSAISKALLKYPETKVVLCANNWGRDDDEVKKVYPIEFASDQEKKYVADLKNKIGKPDLLVCQYHDKYAQHTHELWGTLGCKVHGMLLSADILEYQLTRPDKNFTSDVVFVGGYWPYKSLQIAPYLFPLARPDINLNVKIFGFGPWPVPNFLGAIASNTACTMYSSAKVCPNIFEPHSLGLGYDVNQRTYQIAAAGGFQVCQNVKSVKEDVFNNDEIIFADDPEDFIAKTLFYIQNPTLRIPYIKKSVDTVYAKHTSLHRVSDMLSQLSYDKEALEAQNMVEEVYNNVKNIVQSEEFENHYLELYS